MTQTGEVGTTRGGALVWIFRLLLVAAAAFMAYSWFAPWWSADVAVLPGDDHLILHPWGVETVPQVRANVDTSLFSMPFPEVFAGFMWTYLGVCMLALAASLFVTRRIKIGRFNPPLAVVLIALVGLSYMLAPTMAFVIGELKAASGGVSFLGKSTYIEPQSDAKIKMVSQLRIGFWLSLGAGGAITVLALLRGLLNRKFAA